MRGSRTWTNLEGEQKQRKKRVCFKLSHHALGLFNGVDNPLLKKPRLASSVGQVSDIREGQAAEGGGGGVGEEKEEEEDEVVESAQAHKTAGQVEKSSQLPLLQPLNSNAKPKSYLEKLRSRLSGGQFRMLNEKLYTSSGDEAFRFFQEDPSAFECYHSGYQEQMSRWPSQPLDAIIDWLKKHNKSLIVADFGCGSGRLAKSVNNQVFSLDLVASDDTIIACNMAHTPLKTHSIDVAVFCLSLMGTDYSEFLMEAHRVLKPRGTLLIAEVRSRFDPNNGGTDPAQFIKALSTLNFSCVSKDFSSKFFVVFEFLKQGIKMKSQQCKWPSLKPCIYKRR